MLSPTTSHHTNKQHSTTNTTKARQVAMNKEELRKRAKELWSMRMKG
jgi:hypothetical protein